MVFVKDGVQYDSTVSSVAEKFDYSEEHVRLLARQGKIPSYQRGRKYFFNMAKVEELIVKTKGPTPEAQESVELDDLTDGI